jgi:hypothetical protein
LVRVTFAAGTAPPDASTTVPFSAAVATCAAVGGADSRKEITPTTTTRVRNCNEDRLRKGRQVIAASPPKAVPENCGIFENLQDPGTLCQATNDETCLAGRGRKFNTKNLNFRY